MADDFTLVRRIFEGALDRPEEERERWVRAEADGQADVARQVLEMLGVEVTEAFLDSPLSDALGQLVEDSDLAGKHVGPFRLVRLLGRGGMGSVYLAEQEHPHRLVALKVLEGLPSARARRRFEVESEVLAGLSHPGIAQVFEAGSVPVSSLSLPYFAMEYVEESRTLPEFVETKRLDLTARIELFIAFCDAVQYGHKKGVLHRDLKPANLLVDKEGRPKVIDFGIARAVGTEDSRTQLTSTGEVVGTLSYMAPERLSGDEHAGDASSDVYSLGCVLYELVSGARAVSVAGMSLPEAIRHVSQDRPPPPRHHRADLPRDLNWIVMRAMEADPERRYATVAALAEDLRAFLRHEPVQAGPPSTVYRLQKYVRRHRTGVVVGAAVAFVLATAAIRVAVSRANERRAEEQLRVEEERNRESAVSMLRMLERGMFVDLQQEASDLYPALPQTIPRYEDWLGRAEIVAEGLVETERLVRELAEGKRVPAGEEGGELNRWLREALERHAVELRAFLDPVDGLVASVRRRYEFASTIEARSVTGAAVAAAWSASLERIADPDGIYGGLRWEPQVGLLPLGDDPKSGLEEYAHLLSGEAAVRDANGEVQLAEASGIVLVLVPGGACRIGALRPTIGRRNGTAHVDANAQQGEGPLLELQLDPFLVSKFEMTQAQWERLERVNPALHRSIDADPTTWKYAGSDLHPVELVDWFRTERVLGHLALEMPTSAQWEYAFRGGTTTPRWMAQGGVDHTAYGNLDVGGTERVGCYPANPFGLHDMSGNVTEWCSDGAVGDYRNPEDFARFSTGRALASKVEFYRVRGATFGVVGPGKNPVVPALVTRSAWRLGAEPSTSAGNRGVRPVRPLYLER